MEVIDAMLDVEAVELMPTSVCVPPDDVTDVVGVGAGLAVTVDDDPAVTGGAPATAAEAVVVFCCWPGFTSLPRMLLSDICSR